MLNSSLIPQPGRYIVEIINMFVSAAWVGVISLSISYGITPFLVAFCR